MRGVDEAVHRRVDRRRRAALAVQAVVERGDHLVLAVDAGVDVDERAHPVEPEHGEAGLGQGAEVAAGALHPEQLDVLAGDRVGLGALGGGVAAGVVGVLRVGAEPVGPGDQLGGTVGVRSCSVPSCLGAADAVGLDLLLVAAGEVGRHRVGRQARAPRASRPGRRVRRCRTRP